MSPALLALPLVPQPAEVTSWPERIAWTLAVLAAVAVLYLLMLRGWRRIAAGQSDVPPPSAVPPDPGPVAACVDGVYVSTTTEGDWLDRIVVHGMGVRSRATVTVSAAGVHYARRGASDVFVPAAAVRGVRLERGMAGKFVEEGGLVVLTWAHGDRGLDTGLRTDRAADRDELVAAIEELAGGRGAVPAPAPGGEGP